MYCLELFLPFTFADDMNFTMSTEECNLLSILMLAIFSIWMPSTSWNAMTTMPVAPWKELKIEYRKSKFTLKFVKVMFPIFKQVSIWFETFEIFFAAMKSMLHLNVLAIGINAIKSLSVVYPLKMWEANLFNFKHMFLLEFSLKI